MSSNYPAGLGPGSGDIVLGPKPVFTSPSQLYFQPGSTPGGAGQYVNANIPIGSEAAPSGNIIPAFQGFPPINYIQNYLSTPGDGSGLTSTDSNGGSGLNYILILGLLAVAALAIFMVVH